MDSATVLTAISLFGSLQALLLGLAIFVRIGEGTERAGPTDRRRRVVLGALMVVFGAAVAVIALDHAAWFSEAVPFAWIEHTLALFFPLFLLYARLVVGRPPGRGWLALHFSPLALWILASAAGAITGGLPWWPPILAVVLYQVAYTARAAWIAFAEAEEDLPGLGLLRLLAAGLVVVHLAQGLRFAFSDVALLRDVVPATSTLLIYAVVYRALAASEVLHPPPKPYTASGLEPNRAAREGERLERLMETERLFLRHDLDLDTVAERMELSRTHVSQIVNQGLGIRFNELLSRYRAEEARRLLSDPALDHVTIEAIGERAGFSSRSAFYEAFRRQTGSTPGRYRDQRGD